MPVVSPAHIEARRQQILEAAALCFSRDGFHRTTMQAICREASLSPGAVYQYFRSKEAIIQAMSAAELHRNLALIGELAAQDDTQQVLSDLADAFFKRLDENLPASCRVSVEIWSEALRNPVVGDALRVRVENHLKVFADIVRRAQGRGEINPALDASAVARIMLSSFYGLVLQKALDPGLDVGAYVASLKALHFGSFWYGPLVNDERPPANGVGSQSRNGRLPRRKSRSRP
ncbi:MAG: TetR/AcrR family transcriptional regulator [Chloroflexi bacterium]|nr:TetR/AcrR family transcriptional regulator [Chloroflexota bacterium]